jgi:hypothetical protein
VELGGRFEGIRLSEETRPPKLVRLLEDVRSSFRPWTMKQEREIAILREDVGVILRRVEILLFARKRGARLSTPHDAGIEFK